MKKIILATVLAGIGSTAALAADLGARTYTKAPAMMAPAATWAGLYVGGNVGYGWGAGNTNLDDAIFGLGGSSDSHANGVIGGAQIGYNWQVGSIVTGLEADIQGAGIKGTDARSPSPIKFITATQKIDWFGTVRGRLGVAITPGLLLYATGGLAYGQVNDSADAVLSGGVPIVDFPASVKQTKVGWTAGAGGEWMFAPGWSAKLEYLFLDLGNASAIAVRTPPILPINPSISYDWKNQEHIVRAGVNYHF